MGRTFPRMEGTPRRRRRMSPARSIVASIAACFRRGRHRHALALVFSAGDGHAPSPLRGEGWGEGSHWPRPGLRAAREAHSYPIDFPRVPAPHQPSPQRGEGYKEVPRVASARDGLAPSSGRVRVGGRVAPAWALTRAAPHEAFVPDWLPREPRPLTLPSPRREEGSRAVSSLQEARA